MARQRKKKTVVPEGFPEKSWNKLSSVWREAADSKSTEELEADLVKAARSIGEQSSYMKDDEKLQALENELKRIKEEHKELKGAYTDCIEADKAKIEYCVYLFNTRGAPVNTDTKTPNEG